MPRYVPQEERYSTSVGGWGLLISICSRLVNALLCLCAHSPGAVWYLILRSYDGEEAESPKCGFIGAEPQLYASIYPTKLRSAEEVR